MCLTKFYRCWSFSAHSHSLFQIVVGSQSSTGLTMSIDSGLSTPVILIVNISYYVLLNLPCDCNIFAVSKNENSNLSFSKIDRQTLL